MAKTDSDARSRINSPRWHEEFLRRMKFALERDHLPNQLTGEILADRLLQPEELAALQKTTRSVPMKLGRAAGDLLREAGFQRQMLRDESSRRMVKGWGRDNPLGTGEGLDLRARLHQLQGGRCAGLTAFGIEDCGGRRIPADLGHVDHIVPASKGGTDDERNLQFLCSTCNTKKGDRTP